MLKRSLAIFSLVAGMILFLMGCSKSSHDTLAFIGTESDMKTCYEIYPEQYFPSEISDALREGRFPPDIVGEYEMDGTLVCDSYYEWYVPTTHQYSEIPNYPDYKGMYIIVKDQINGMATIKYSHKNQPWNDFEEWKETQAYVYGNVYSENKNDFVLCFELIEDNNGVCSYHRGIMIKGKIDETGIKNIHRWSVVKDVTINTTTTPPYTLKVGGHEHFYANIAERQDN